MNRVSSDDMARKKSPGPGRPLRAGKVADERITIRLTKTELADWKRRAGEQPIGDWVREQCNRPTRAGS